MKNIIMFIVVLVGVMVLGLHCESKKDPYQEGMHWDYSISCENGFVYKIKDRAAIQILNSDGTPLKCGHKIY